MRLVRRDEPASPWPKQHVELDLSGRSAWLSAAARGQSARQIGLAVITPMSRKDVKNSFAGDGLPRRHQGFQAVRARDRRYFVSRVTPSLPRLIIAAATLCALLGQVG